MASTTSSAQFLTVCRRLKRMYTARVDPEKARLFARDGIVKWLLSDSRGVDLSMAYNPTFVILSSSKPLFFNSLKPTVSLDVTSLVVRSYGCGDGRSGPTHCAFIGVVRGDRWRAR